MWKLLVMMGVALAASGVSLTGLGLATMGRVAKPAAAERDPRDGFALGGLERRLVDAINAYRAERGLAEVRVEPHLMAAARGRTNARPTPGASGRWRRSVPGYGHQTNHQGPMEAARAAGYSGRAVGENLAWGQRTPEDAVGQPAGRRGGWQTSSGHARNMRGDWQHVGVGVEGRTYVAMFGRY